MVLKRAAARRASPWTNVLGKDRDFGYHVLRLSEKQPWRPVYLFQPLWNLLMALYFQWGVAIHDDELGGVRTGEKTREEVRPKLRKLLRKVGRQVAKDYLVFPCSPAPASFMCWRETWRRICCAICGRTR